MKRSASTKDGSLSPPPMKRRYESTTTSKTSIRSGLSFYLSTITEQTVASFFTPVSKKEPEQITWRILKDSLLVGKYDPNAVSSALPDTSTNLKRTKIAAFDFDSTLIQTSSGNVFGKSAADWRWWHVCVPGALKKLYDEGFLIVVLSNQGGISLKSDPKTVKSDQKRLSVFKAKATSVFAQLAIPISIYAATTRDIYRKPRPRMWDVMLDDHDLDVGEGPNLVHSVFVGDAGGRAKRIGFKEDHSSSDRDFAANVGINFQTPEEYFLGEVAQPFVRTFDPSHYLNAATANFPTATNSSHATAHVTSTPLSTARSIDKNNPLDVVLFCGSPGAGKSTFYWRNLKNLGYERINQDTLKTRQRCMKIASECLSLGKSVAVDNTNADVETRAIWIQLAQRFGLSIRCIYFTAHPKLCEHNDTVRALNQDVFNPEKRTILPHSAFSNFSSRFQEPQLKEGFHDIVRVDFTFQGDDNQRQIWTKYWI
ncbi:hypothetical protein MMC06_005496 [Schaereria dolodes]|nr:hypothetical protein [Schaereria dolodes]